MAYKPLRSLSNLVCKPYVSRREAFTGFGEFAFLVGAGLYGSISFLDWMHKDTLANKLLDDFPEKIPGAREIKKYKSSDAKYCLVHIKQRHVIERSTEETIKNICEVQDNIYSILSYLIDKKKLEHVYYEGVAVKEGKIQDDLNTAWRNIEKILNKIPKKENIILEEINELEDKLKDDIGIGLEFPNPEEAIKYRNELRDKINILGEEELPKAKKIDEEYESRIIKNKRVDAVRRLNQENRLKIMGGETSEANGITSALTFVDLNNPRNIILFTAANEAREDILLDIISQNKDTMAVTVYGGVHNWLDNIESWNRSHNKERFSLITVTPNSYRDQ